MATDVKQLFSEALSLPVDERAHLAQELIESLDESTDPWAASAWVEEIERRSREVDDGTADLQEWSAVRERIRARLRSR